MAAKRTRIGEGGGGGVRRTKRKEAGVRTHEREAEWEVHKVQAVLGRQAEKKAKRRWRQEKRARRADGKQHGIVRLCWVTRGRGWDGEDQSSTVGTIFKVDSRHTYSILNRYIASGT